LFFKDYTIIKYLCQILDYSHNKILKHDFVALDHVEKNIKINNKIRIKTKKYVMF